MVTNKRYLGANVMLIQGINSLKFCAYVGRSSSEDTSDESTNAIDGATNDQLAPKGVRTPSEPLFAQHDAKKDRSRILALLNSHNEKRRLIKLLEKETVNGNDSLVSPSVLSRVEGALQKILQQETESLYQEVKTILFDTKRQPNVAPQTPWVSVPFTKELLSSFIHYFHSLFH